jgi:hypothetical protein
MATDVKETEHEAVPAAEPAEAVESVAADATAPSLPDGVETATDDESDEQTGTERPLNWSKP